MEAEKYLEIWLGSNMNTETLKWKAIVEFAEDYHKSRLKEIMPTDEEIEKQLDLIERGTTPVGKMTLRIMGFSMAKWFKSEIEKCNK